jgi:hypothetical protein
MWLYAQRLFKSARACTLIESEQIFMGETWLVEDGLPFGATEAGRGGRPREEFPSRYCT